MASLRNAVKRRTHKERSQPSNRKSLGILEKHKDYVKRARFYNEKKELTRKLALEAALKNPEEFNKGMVGKSLNAFGQHFEDDEEFTDEQNRVLGDKNLAYLENLRVMLKREIKDMEQAVHFRNTSTKRRHMRFNNDGTPEEVDNCLEVKEANDENETEDRLAQRKERLLKTEQLIAHARLERNLNDKSRESVKVLDATESRPAVFKWKVKRNR